MDNNHKKCTDCAYHTAFSESSHYCFRLHSNLYSMRICKDFTEKSNSETETYETRLIDEDNLRHSGLLEED